MLKKRFILVAIVILAIAVVFTGCANVKQTTAPGGQGSQQKIKWKIATSWPDSMFLHKIPVKWAEEINKASGGRLEVEVFPAGAIVGGQEVLDSANMGSINGYHSATNLWVGKMPGAVFFSSIPMTLEPDMHLGWIYEGGGLELWQKMYDQAGYNVKVIPLGFTGPETLAWSNKKMEKLEDWKGVKYRTAGWWAEILRQNGVSVTTLPPGELYQALDRGVIDALEFATPLVDRDLAFYEVTKFFTGPGMHQPSTMYYIGINKKTWNELPDDLKKLVELSAKSTTLWSFTNDLQKSIEATEFYKQKGIQPVVVDKATQLKLQEDAWAFIEKKSGEQGGLFKEIWQSIKDYRKRYIEYNELMTPVRGGK